MRDSHDQQEDFMTLVSLESLVPSGHIVRLMEKHIDFSFIDRRTEGLYSTKGRTSVAPQIFILKNNFTECLQLIDQSQSLHYSQFNDGALFGEHTVIFLVKSKLT